MSNQVAPIYSFIHAFIHCQHQTKTVLLRLVASNYYAPAAVLPAAVAAAPPLLLLLFVLSVEATLQPIHRSMGVSRAASTADRSSAGAEKASLTPSKSPMCSAVVVEIVVVSEDLVLLPVGPG